MKLFQSLFTAMMVATISFSTFASNNNDDWELIATKTVNFQTETDTVTPNGLLKNRNFSKIKIKCIQGTVDLKDIKVTMTDGSEKKLTSMGTLTNGMSTRAWTLPGAEDAKLKRLEMKYSSWGNMKLDVLGVSKKAKVEIWGKKRTQKAQ
ncbi:hypothetical protein RRJ93_002548 [Vibrio parahaemolyticus]|nr:hypothetical protein [Vibrio parahaemolyticus]ELI5424552.1 hypothetical protein [Vibrio parahaemolyticus]